MKALLKSSNAKNLIAKQAFGFAATKIMTMRDGLKDAIFEEMERDEKVFIWGEETAGFDGAYKVTKGLQQKFGKRRVMDAPITEHGFAGVACGAAWYGLRPICEFMSWNFALQAMDHLINTAAKTLYMSGGDIKCPIVFRGNNGCATYCGCTHSQCVAAYMAHLPGMITLSAYDTEDARGLFKAAVRNDNPVSLLENECLLSVEHPISEEALDKDFVVPIGKARIMRAGKDLTIVSHGRALDNVMKAVKELEQEGIDVEVVNLRSLKPLDRKSIVESVKKTNHCVSVEEGWPQHGIGAEIAAMMFETSAYDKLNKPMERVTAQDTPTPYSFDLQDNSVPTVQNVKNAVKKCLGKKKE